MRLFGPFHKRSRSASMQLSINAIVILVMAMAVLGLGLGLIRGVLGSGKDKLQSSIDQFEVSDDATADNPITGANKIRFKRGAENTFAINFYNKDRSECSDTDLTKGAFVGITCKDLSGTKKWSVNSLRPLTVDVSPGSQAKLGAIVDVDDTGTSDSPSGVYPCTITVYCGKLEYAQGSNVPDLAGLATSTVTMWNVESTSAFVEIYT